VSEPIRSLDPVQPLPPPARAAASAPTSAPAQASDRLKLSEGTLIEADLALRLKGRARATANGTVKVDHRLVDRYAARMFQGSQAFQDVHLAYDAARGLHVATGMLNWHGLSLPFTAPTQLVAEGGRVGLRFEPMHVQLFGLPLRVPNWAARRLMPKIASAFGSAGISAQPEPAKNRVMMDPNGLLRELKMLPEGVSLDTAQTQLGLATTPQGDLRITLQAPDPVAPAKATPGSDLAIEADRGALADVLAVALGDRYELKALEPTADGFKLRGEVEYEPLSDAVNAFQGLFAAMAVASGDGAALGQVRPQESRGPLDLAVRVDGTRLRIQPKPQLALEPVAAALAKAGFQVRRGKDALEVDLRDLLAGKPVDVESFKLGGDGVRTRVHLDLDRMLPQDKLEGPA
jgi:hypothetical protein